MPSYRQLIEHAKSHLDSLGVAYRKRVGWPLLPWSIRVVERKLGFKLPRELSDFYREIGNGFRFAWATGDESDSHLKIGGIHVPSLNLMLRNWRSRRKYFLYDANAADKYGFPYTDDPDLAKRTAARMWNWLPVIHDDNGDEFSIDIANESRPVIFDKHDWLDGGTGENGFPVASNWRSFFTNWATQCFQHPKSQYWPSVLGEDGIEWDSHEFDQRYIVKSK